ncbi:MAG: SDR family NAD(P)-dependent oxidoreductase [Phycisphaerales bacterium]|nr:SDR family NAD(P)-dependent oxidoreductase [Phycisphaerales bacterium]
MAKSLCDKVAIVSGASRGLGAALAMVLARRGARLALMGRSRERLEAVAADVRSAGADALVAVVDVRDRAAVDQAVGEVIERWGGVDVLFNVAGVKVQGSMESTSYEAIREALDVNFGGVLRCCRAVLPVMRARGRGHLVNVSSVQGKRATPYRGAYAASKAALNAMTDALRVELSGTGIDVTLVCPGRLDHHGDPRRMAMGYDRAAEAMVRAVERGRREVVLTWSGRALVWLNVLAPGVVDRLLRGLRDERQREFERVHREQPDQPFRR